MDNPKQIRRPRRWWIGAIALAFLAVIAGEIGIVIYRAEPILQGRVIETLSTRFHSRVELAGFHVSVAHGLQVSVGRLSTKIREIENKFSGENRQELAKFAVFCGSACTNYVKFGSKSAASDCRH